ncbi:GntR family transcriptional regulator [Streptomyces radicis]|uniref:GntR family transcriptional regulator n=1 Tax=Streptomyces radicis TaxID=1750517 RepID=A0A3A9W1G4_9ACTN|nr:GntR family transcriptional regulator [Streptomyces radicis]RKN06273.1 GntR family transcriptional regulator [Streptomyces radicis]RKN18603.1 GntR family transcriptional regulator [Streptomyces radicis]
MTSSSNFTLLTKRESLRETVAHALRAAIISGEMEPGVVYSAPALSARFGVSATPVREAMLDLVREGMVTSVPNKGFRVTEVSEADLDHITELRLLIEPPTIRRVVPLVPRGDLPRLRRMADEIVDFAERKDLVRYTEADRLFHLELLGYSGNPRLVETISRLRSGTRLLGLAALAETGELRESAEEHLVLMDLIRDGDERGAFALMNRHIGHVRGKWAGAHEEALAGGGAEGAGAP